MTHPHRTLAEVAADLESLAERQRDAFPDYTADTYAAEQHAPDPEDENEDMG